MKEPYNAFWTSLFCAIPYMLIEHLSKPIQEYIAYIFAFVSVGCFIRGIFLLLPFPLDGNIRKEFYKAHPEALAMERPDNCLLYTSPSPRD